MTSFRPRSALGTAAGLLALAAAVTARHDPGIGDADLSALSVVVDLAPGVYVPAVEPPPALLLDEEEGEASKEPMVPPGTKCPDPENPPDTDGDGDGSDDDSQNDLNGDDPGKAKEFPNGKLEGYCIDGKYFSVVWTPKNEDGSDGEPKVIGKCPFDGGQNKRSSCVDPETGELVGTTWCSTDGGGDDDGDGALDKWTYTFDPATGTLTSDHYEDGVQQPDGSEGPAPGVPYDFGDTLPESPYDDDPGGLVAGGGFPGTPAEPMVFEVSEIPDGGTVTMTVETVVANEGPITTTDAMVTVSITTWGSCTIDGATSASRSYRVPVTAGTLTTLQDTWAIATQLASPYNRYTIRTTVTPVDAGVSDPEPSDDAFTSTFVADSSDGPWLDLGSALDGVSGPPLLAGSGAPVAGQLFTLDLTNARPGAFGLLFFAVTSTPVPFFGGTLVAFPWVIEPVGVVTDAAGAVPITTGIPLGTAPGIPLSLQYGIEDPAAVAGVSLSNAVLGITQ